MKAILVIDMPKECSECPCFYDYLCCQAKGGLNVLGDERPKECPLKPMPEKKILDEELFMSGNFRLIHARFTGWNDCIDTITGETE